MENLLSPGDWRLVKTEFTKAIRRLGLKGLWMIVDSLEIWLEDSTGRLLAFVFFRLPRS